MSHTKEDLRELQNKTLEEKIQISTARIIEWYEGWGGQVYVSFSGGKDSTVLLDLVRKIYPDVPAVFADTGLEYPEIRDFVKGFENVVWVKPKMTFNEVLTKYGYPIVSKNIACRVGQVRKSKRNDTAAHKMFEGAYPGKNGKESQYNCTKWKFLLDADFKIDDLCCDVMKKAPLHHYEKESGRKAFIGTLTEESRRRRDAWLKNGCNAFDTLAIPQSTPMAFWTEQDVLKYIYDNKITIASPYGEIIYSKGKYSLSKMNRTGCVFCAFGCHREKLPNRYQQMATTHPQLYDYCMRGGKYDESGMWIPDKGLGMAKVLDYINVKWWNDGDEEKRDEYRRIYHEKEEAEAQRKLTESETNE